MTKREGFRSGLSFFLVTFSCAVLSTIGARLTGWFSKIPDATQIDLVQLGVVVMVGVIVIAVGASLRRMGLIELRSALLGASSILLAIPISALIITHVWPVAWSILSALGLVLLLAGFFVSYSFGDRPGAVEHD